MTFKDWCDWIDAHWAAHSTMSNSQEQATVLCGMPEEMGEVMGCIKREYRGDLKGQEALKLELGDMLHYTVRFMQQRGIDPEEVFAMNRDKLVKRYGDS